MYVAPGSEPKGSLQPSLLNLFGSRLLHFFIAGLRRLLYAPANRHEQHTLVDSVLFMAPGCSHKYIHNVPEILALDKQREELETDEADIWCASNHEKEPIRAEVSSSSNERWAPPSVTRSLCMPSSALMSSTSRAPPRRATRRHGNARRHRSASARS
jgi:hypothetical protein